MQIILHPSSERGHVNHGWLDSRHTFSFGGWHNPERMRFGVLRVINDDWVDGGQGFGAHPHDNMEIISLPLHGALEHRDSLGNTHVIRKGDIQAMSAGTGIQHAEFNHDPNEKVNFLQIWIYPNQKNVAPRYDQKEIGEISPNTLKQILSPDARDEGVWIHQQAWFHMARLSAGGNVAYHQKKTGNGIYLFVIEGKIKIDNIELSKRDGAAITDTDKLMLEGIEEAEVLIMEIPMN